MKADWLEIAGLFEKATGPDRALSNLLAVKLGYAKPCADTSGSYFVTLPGEKPFIGNAPHYTASLDAITALIERELPGYAVQSHTHDGPNNDAYARIDERPFPDDRLHTRGVSYAATEPLARSAALCRAKAEMCDE